MAEKRNGKGVGKAKEVQVLLRFVVTSPDGKTLSDTGDKESESFVLNFLKYFYYFTRALTGDAVATDGVTKEMFNSGGFGSQGSRVTAPINNALYGIVVGIGTTPLSNTDYKLATQCGEGTGANQFVHGACTIYKDAQIIGSNVDTIIMRSVTNLSGATITVKEAGLYIAPYWNNSFRYFCAIRDLLVITVDVPDKCSLTVYYTIRTTV